MKLSLHGSGTLIVTRELGDPKFYNSGWGSGDSRLLYHIQKYLNARGADLVKVRMWKDGHLYGDDTTQYLRPRNMKKPKGLCVYIYDPYYAVRSAAEEWNKAGYVCLIVDSAFLDTLQDWIKLGALQELLEKQPDQTSTEETK